MPIGPFVRRLFGPYERQIADAYRRLFIDLDDWTDRIGVWAPRARNILEVGCGEGAMTERLVGRYPDARITAIDVTPRVGRLFSADPARVVFRQSRVEDIAAEQPGSFDLVVLSDVIHHVPTNLRASLLRGIRDAMTPDGTLVFKEWIRTRTPIHWACLASDRFITGDSVSYLDEGETRALLQSVFGTGTIHDMCHARPWRNNLALLLRPG